MRRLRALAVVPLAFAFAGTVASCVGSTGEACQVGSDCKTGVCEDGLCIPSGTTATSSTSGSATTGSTGTTGTGTSGATTSASSGTGGSAICSPNHDGVITRDEVPIEVGLSAKFEAATNVTFSTSGTPIAGGKRDWNLAASFSGDHQSVYETLPIAGQWFAGQYAGATYAAKLSESSDLLGVFEVTNDAILLHGVVSPTSGATQTELTYEPPVAVLEFPLMMGKTWSTNSVVSGMAEGVFATYTEDYSFDVDAAGTLEAPFGTFDVLRVQSTLTRTVGFTPTIVRSFAFASECFGTVASITSQNDEPNTEFSSVAELKRLAP